jgi:hypothetical protein
MVNKIIFTQQELEYLSEIFDQIENNNPPITNKKEFIVNTFYERYKHKYQKAITYPTLHKNYIEFNNSKRTRPSSISTLITESANKRSRNEGKAHICIIVLIKLSIDE